MGIYKSLKRARISMVGRVVLLLAVVAAATLVGLTSAGADDTPGSVNIDKTAEWVDTSNNIAKVTLTVDGVPTQKTSDVVLVIDRSGSMAWELDGSPPEAGEPSRLDLAKDAATEFVNYLLADQYAGLNQIAVVSFGSAGYGAGTVTTDIGLTGTTGKANVIDKIDDLLASGGTTTQAGIKEADSILDGSTADNKIIVLLSDGQPTYSYRATAASLAVQTDWDLNYPTVNADGSALTRKLTSFNTTIMGNGSAYYYPTGSYTVDSQYVNNNGLPTISQALIAKQQGYVIYTVGFALAGQPEGQYVMEYCASSAGKYYETAENISTVFAEIAGSIIAAGREAIIEDTMGYGFSPDYEWELIKPGDPDYAAHPITASRGTYELSVVDPPGVDKITWDLGTITEEAATLTYYIRLKPTSLFSDADMPLDTNSEATISYEDYLNQPVVERPFPVPELGCPLASISVVKTDEEASPLTGAGFTLYSDEACTLVVAAEQFVNTNPTTLFAGMVRGNTYYLKETTAPPDCFLNPTVYKLVVGVDGSVSAYIKVGEDWQLVDLVGGSLVIENVVKNPAIAIEKTVDPVEFGAPGTATYTYSVTNGGNIPLTNVVVTDDNATPAVFGDDFLAAYVGGDTNLDNALDLTEVWTFTATRAISQADIDAGVAINNWATASSTEATSEPDDATINFAQAPAVSVDKTVTSVDTAGNGVIDHANEIIGYQVVVSNDGNISLTGTLSDPLPGISAISGPVESYTGGIAGTLEVGETWTYTYTYTVTQQDIDDNGIDYLGAADNDGDIDNTATFTPSAGAAQGDSAEVPLAAPSLAIDLQKVGTYVDSNSNGLYDVGDSITYVFTVTNQSTVTLTNVMVTDPTVTVAGGPIASLAPGASDSSTFTGSYALTQADIDAGTFTNTATVTGYYGTTPVTDTDDDTQAFTPTLAIDLQKVGTYVDSNGNTKYDVGDSITYVFTVTNQSTVTLTNVMVTDPTVTVAGGPIASLAPGASDSSTFTGSYALTQADIDAGTFTNTATVTGYYGTTPVTDADDDTQAFTPTLAIDLQKVGTYVDSNGNTKYDVGDSITYVFTVTNQSTVTLTNVMVTDPTVTVAGGPIASLAPGAVDSSTFTGSYALTQADIDAGTFTNTATVTGYYGTTPVTDTDDDTQAFTPTLAIDLQKVGTYVDSNSNGLYDVGDSITYVFTVTNQSTVTLTNVMVTDPTVTVAGGPIASLAPGAVDSSTFTGSYALTQADIDAGTFTNTATVAGYYGTTPVTDADDDTQAFTPTLAIDLQKVGTYVDSNSNGLYDVGDSITYVFTVTNQSTVTLTNVMVTDPTVTVAGGPIASLAPGASDSSTFTGSYALTQADIDAGTFTNTATVTGYYGTTPVTDTDDDTQAFTPTLAIDLQKVGTYVDSNGNTKYDVGDSITYVFTVTNQSTVTLTNVMVTDPTVTVAGGPIASLAPGAVDSTTFTGSYALTQADIDAGTFTNTATVAGYYGTTPVTDADDDTQAFTPTLAIDLQKVGTYVDSNSNGLYDVGDSITYVFTVTNQSTVTLTNVMVTDPTVTVAGGPIASLAPGASDSSTFTGSYALTQADIDAGTFTNTATVTGYYGTTPVTDADDDTQAFTPTLAIDLQKVGTYVDSNGNTKYDVGDSITYVFTVTNQSTVTLTNVMVTDPTVTVAGGPIASLAPGAVDSSTFTGSYALTQADIDAGTFTNTATVTGYYGTTPVTDTDDDTQAFTQVPVIAVEKTVNPGEFSAPGTATYGYSVTNAGNISLTGVVVTDDNATPDDTSDDFLATYVGGDTDADGKLDLDETWTFRATRAITQADVDAGTAITNLAVASSTEATSEPDEATITFGQAPALDVAKDLSPDTQIADVAGETITYAITVANIGNVTLTNVVVSDPFATGGIVRNADLVGDGDNDLEVGETWSYTAGHIVTQAELDAGVNLVNTATADSDQTGPDSDDATVPVSQNPALDVVKALDPVSQVADAAGETITYAITVQNTGNRTLTGVTVTDPFATGGIVRNADLLGDGDNDLEVGETWSYTAGHIVTQAELDAGVNLVNTATADSDQTGPDSDDATVPVSRNPALDIVKALAPVGQVADVAGETITYAITVANIGNVTLTNVVVSDPFATGGIVRNADLVGDGDNDLEVGETWSCTAGHIVTQAELDAGLTLVNTATADSDQTGPDSDDASVPVSQNPALDIVKALDPPDQVADVAGESITYTITVQNTGNRTLTGVTVSDPFATGGIVRNADLAGDNDNDLEVGEVWSYTATHTVTQGEIDAGEDLLNVVTADSDQTGPDSDDATVPVGANPALDVVKALYPADQVADVAGESITYAISVQNNGNQTLTGVTVSDPFATGGIVRNADITGDNDDLLEVGEVWSYTATHIVTQGEIDTNGGGDGFLENTVTADSAQTEPDTDDASVPVAQNPALDIVKALDPADQVANVAGESITYSITVQNSGNRTLTGVTVSDPFATGGIVRVSDITGDNDNLLEVGETWSYTATHIVTQGEIDAGVTLVNVATADSDQTPEDTDDASVPVAQNPALDIVKLLDPADQIADVAGENITYTITVHNTGNRTLTGVTVSDPFATGGIVRNTDVTGDNDNLLEVGEVWSYTAKHVLTQGEIDAGEALVNTATADSDQTGPDSDDAVLPVGQNAALDIVKALDPADQVANVAGEAITYAITVRNAGNQTLTGVTVSDPFATGGIVRNSDITGDNDDLLEVGEVWSYTATHIVTQGEIDAGATLVNVATADSNESPEDSDDADVPVAQNPALDVVKALDPADQVADVAGESITYAIRVQNSGNRTLTGVTVSDPFATGGIVRNSDITGDNDNLLEVGEVWSYTATHILIQGEIDAGEDLLNVATADSDQTGPATDDASVPVAQNPALDIVKALDPADQVADVAGESIAYAITVQNSGNQTLTGVTVSDPFATGGIVRNADITGDNDDLLEVGEVWSYTATHTVTQGEIDAGEDLLNVVTADSDQTGPDSDDATVPVGANPALDVVKALYPADQVADVAGESITYAITVQNSGNQTLTGVTVSDPLATGGIVRNADITGDNDDLLEVGEVWSYTATHILTQGEIDAGEDLVNVATADSNQTPEDTDDATAPVAQNPALDVLKALDPADQVADVAGESITYAITVQNSGNQTLTGVTVSDPFATGGIVRNTDITGDNDNLLEVGEVWSYTATHILTQGEIDAGVTLVNVATADSDQTGPDTDDATVPLGQNPALDIVKALSPADQVADVAGESITYAIRVQNSGNRTLTGVTVSDPFATGGIVRNTDITGDNDDLLEVGEVWSYTATHILTQGEIDAGVTLVNVATADSDQTGPDTDDATVPVFQNPNISIDKTVTDVAGRGPSGKVEQAGDVISYRVVVTNTGSMSLTGTLTDALPGISAISGPVESIATDGILAVGETWTFMYTYTVTQADITGHGGCDGDIDNTATFTPSAGTPKSDSEEVPIEVPDILPDISVTKTASVTSVPATGGYVDFTFVVTNHSDEPVTLTSLKDSVFGELLSETVRIAAHGSYTLTINRWIACGAANNQLAGEMAVNCPPCTCVDHYNVVTATARDDQGNQDTAKDDAMVHFTYVAPSISVTKTASVASVPASGGHVDFTFVVTNNGVEAVTLTSLNDSIFGELLGGPVTIAGHDSFTLTITRWIANDSSEAAQSLFAVSCVPLPPYCGEHHNVVNATAYDCRGNKATAKDDATVRFTYGDRPDITVTKTASACSVPASGADVGFTFVVTNNGTQTATLTSLMDSEFGELLSGPVTIAPQDSYTLTITRWIGCASTSLQVGGLAVSCPVPTCLYHYNKVTAVACDAAGNKDTATDDAKVYFTSGKPDISVIKTAGAASVPRTGSNVAFTFVVTNNGGEAVTLTSLCDSVFGELLSGQVTIAAHDSYTLTVTRWVGCVKSGLTLGGLEVSCQPPSDPCAYHYNKVTAVAYDAAGNKDTATDDAWVMYTDADLSGNAGIGEGESPESATAPENGGDATIAQTKEPSGVTQGDELEAAESTSGTKGFPYYLLAIPGVVLALALALLVRSRFRPRGIN